MPQRLPAIELNEYQRLHALERQVWYSPVAIVVGVLGLGAAAYTFWRLSRGLVTEPQHLFIGYGCFLITYLGLLGYYHAYRFPRLKCPSCGKRLEPFIADIGEGDWRSVIRVLEIGGRYYRQPYDEDDRRPWIRLMRTVRACHHCKTYVDCSRFHYETCTEDELYEIQRRVTGW